MTTQSPDATEQVERVARAIAERMERSHNGYDLARAAIAALPSNATSNDRLVEEIVSAWAFAHDINGAARNDLFARLRAALPSNATTNASLVEALRYDLGNMTIRCRHLLHCIDSDDLTREDKVLIASIRETLATLRASNPDEEGES